MSDQGTQQDDIIYVDNLSGQANPTLEYLLLEATASEIKTYSENPKFSGHLSELFTSTPINWLGIKWLETTSDRILAVLETADIYLMCKSFDCQLTYECNALFHAFLHEDFRVFKRLHQKLYDTDHSKKLAHGIWSDLKQADQLNNRLDTPVKRKLYLLQEIARRETGYPDTQAPYQLLQTAIDLAEQAHAIGGAKKTELFWRRVCKLVAESKNHEQQTLTRPLDAMLFASADITPTQFQEVDLVIETRAYLVRMMAAGFSINEDTLVLLTVLNAIPAQNAALKQILVTDEAILVTVTTCLNFADNTINDLREPKKEISSIVAKFNHFLRVQKMLKHYGLPNIYAEDFLVYSTADSAPVHFFLLAFRAINAFYLGAILEHSSFMAEKQTLISILSQLLAHDKMHHTFIKWLNSAHLAPGNDQFIKVSSNISAAWLAEVLMTQKFDLTTWVQKSTGNNWLHYVAMAPGAIAETQKETCDTSHYDQAWVSANHQGNTPIDLWRKHHASGSPRLLAATRDDGAAIANLLNRLMHHQTPNGQATLTSNQRI